MNKKTLQVAKIVEGCMGENELVDWWRITINSKLRKENGRTLNTRQLVQIFRALNKPFRVERTRKFVGRKPFIFYKIEKR